ncbi:hypothetical protein [Caballeronia sp. GAFFF2]|uniref:hypothetical protein n=1 Tax=Caballeronia sp. GAFFF2 TaxID=2921741 RepID=UPI0020286E5F|nr:hypothetical protein [Caballeronia sp. GAFFF2]
MKAKITSHFAVEDIGPEIHQFGFTVEDGFHTPMVETISLRTARVLVSELPDGTAFIAMLRVIVAALPEEYDSLVGRVFIE